MRNKKSAITIETMIALAIGVIALFVIAVIITKLYGQSGAKASDFLSSADDCDGDGIADFYDKCDCLLGDEKNEGCPINIPKAEIKREEECHKVTCKYA